MQANVKIGIVSWYEPKKGAMIKVLPQEEQVELTPEEVFVPSKLLINIRLSEGQLVQYLPNEEDHSIVERINPLNSYPDKKSYY